jgi:hypothetical protein
MLLIINKLRLLICWDYGGYYLSVASILIESVSVNPRAQNLTILIWNLTVW